MQRALGAFIPPRQESAEHYAPGEVHVLNPSGSTGHHPNAKRQHIQKQKTQQQSVHNHFLASAPSA
jgi:hypothetical protein